MKTWTAALLLLLLGACASAPGPGLDPWMQEQLALTDGWRR